KLKKFRYGVHYLLLFIPLINTLIKKIQVARFSQMIGVLLGSGISVVQAFKVAAESIEHPVYRASLEKIASSIQGGENIGLYLEAHPRLFSPLVTQMITVGEETGRLDKSFLSVSMFTEEEIDEIIKVLTTLLEPVLMLVIGGLVGFVAIAVITPIYQLTSGIGG
ncbi:pilus assembly protein PilC, partial [Candidatus Uhrbacteria bacterium CG_4_9_14_3_um_filter_50_9]